MTPDGLIDLSPFLTVGSNTIRVYQSRDTYASTFVIRAHEPTKAQLSMVERKRTARKAWLAAMKEEITKPWDFPKDPWET
jgi:hypothetical protein